MNKLAEALSLLGILEIKLRNEAGEVTSVISPREHAKALFTNLYIAGYLDEPLIKKAVDYLSIAKPFSCDNKTLITDLKKTVDASKYNNEFNAELFFTQFAKLSYLEVDDIIDIIVFLQQTAFDRQHGVERDRLQVKSWMEESKEKVKECATNLGVVTPLPPMEKQYAVVGIMGASSRRVKTRLQYFSNLTIDCDFVLALAGNRELSKGLDEEDVMEKLAATLNKPLNYITKPIGKDKRDFLDGITETMLVNYLINEICPSRKMLLIDSPIEQGHWRVTTAQNIKDIAPLIIDKIQAKELTPAHDGRYHVLIIAEQPYSTRMAKQIQREFNRVIEEKKLKNTITIVVEGCGSGISNENILQPQTITSLSSELGALMAERFSDARLALQARPGPGLSLRDADLIMFAKRDDTFKEYQQKREFSPQHELPRLGFA